MIEATVWERDKAAKAKAGGAQGLRIANFTVKILPSVIPDSDPGSNFWSTELDTGFRRYDERGVFIRGGDQKRAPGHVRLAGIRGLFGGRPLAHAA